MNLSEARTYWSPASVQPGPLAARIASAALVVGIVGGAASVCLAVLFAATTPTPVARVLALGLPLVLVVLISRRLSAVTDGEAHRSGRWLLWTAGAAFVLVAAAQGWAALDGFDLGSAIKGTAAVVFFGALFGLVPATAAAVVLISAVLALRAARSRMSLRSAQVGLTAVAALVAAAFDLWAAVGVHGGSATGMTAALAGTGAALTARWCLEGRRPRLA